MVDFVKPISNKDVTACQLLINDLKKHLPDDPTAWEQPLISLTKGIEHYHHHETLLGIMHLLSPQINEALFIRLISSPDFNYLCLNSLIEYINHLFSERVTQVRLINYLLTSRVSLLNHPEAQELLLKLNAKEQRILLTQLNDLEKQCAPIINEETQYPNQRKLNQTYKENYKQLLSLLTTAASAKEITEQGALCDDPCLANLLLMQLREIEQNEAQQKKLLSHVLKEKNQYDWDNPLFNKTIKRQLIALFAMSSAKELKDLFKQYSQITGQHYATDYIQFLDELYAATQNSDLISHCIDAIDDGDYSITINFLTRSKINNQALRLLCLKKIGIEQLASICGHMVALSQMEHQELFTDYINVLCSHLKKLPSPQQLLLQLAINIHSLPINEEQIAITTISNSLKTTELISLWLQTLVQLPHHKTSILPHCFQFIKENSAKFHLILPVLKNLSREDLLTLYLLMLSKGVNKNVFHCFAELFKDVETHPQLFYILSHTPAIHHDLLHEFITPLDDKTLISLIDSILSHTEDYTEFKRTINQLLLIFCQRLYANANALDPINQWQNQPFTNTLIHNLLDNPECVYHLTTTYSSIYSLVTWTSPVDAFKHRMDAVLNCIELEDHRINHIALNWLSYFHNHPEQFAAVFYNLNYTESNRTSIGKKNLRAIKQACWELMKPGVSYVDEQFSALTYPSKPESLSLVTPHLIKEEYLQKAPYQGAVWIAHHLNEYPLEMNGSILITLLMHSLDEITQVNWEKAIIWFENQRPEEQLFFARQLLNKAISVPHNPLFVHQTQQWLTQSPFVESLWPHLEPLHWDWLLKHSSQEQLGQHLSHWLDLILQQHEPSQLNLGKLLSLAPQEEQLISTLLKKTALSTATGLAQLILQLSLEPDCSIHFRCLYQLISEQDKNSSNQLLKMIIPQLTTDIQNTHVLHMLSALILKAIPTLSSHDAENRNLIINYLKLLNTLIQKTEHGKQLNELKELMFRLLQKVIHSDVAWSHFIAGEAIFTEIMFSWLHSSDLNAETESTNNHPLNQLLLAIQPAYLEAKLKNDALFQKWLQATLINTSQLNDEQFSMLFNSLLRHNKASVAQKILAQAQLSAVQTHCSELLANALNPIVLFELFEKYPNQAHITRALFCHRDGLQELSSIQRTQLVAGIQSTASLLNILDGRYSLAMRLNFIKELFLIYEQDANILGQKLASWFINSEDIAALSNFIIEKRQQAILKQMLEEKVYYQNSLNDYLHQPTRDMPLNKDSFLYHWARQRLLHPDLQKPCNPCFIQQLPAEDIFEVIKKQFYLTQSIQSGSNAVQQFSEVLAIGLKGITSIQNNEINQWIFQFALFSSLSASLNDADLKTYLTAIKPQKIATLIHQLSEKEQRCRKAYELLQNIKPAIPITEFIKQVSNEDLLRINELINAAETLNLSELKDVLSMAISVKTQGSSNEHISTLDLSKTISVTHNVWLQANMQLMSERINHVSERLTQLIAAGFSYNLSGHNEERLHQLTTKNLAHTPGKILAQCLNSYAPLFTEADFKANPFLETLNQLLSSPQRIKEISIGLDGALMNQVITTAIKNPAHYAGLLEKLINSNSRETCIYLLQSELNQLLKQEDGLQRSDISQLTAEQIEAFPSAVLARILSIQRLLFFNKPIDELCSFSTAPNLQTSIKERQLFSADASLYMVLTDLEKKSKKPMTQCGLWLIQHNQTAVKTYANCLDRFNSGKEVNYPAMQYHWLCWKAFIFSATQQLNNVLNDGLIEWLRKLDEDQLREAPDLDKLMLRIADQHLIPKVLKSALAQCKTLNATQIAWLCERSMKFAPKDNSLIPIIINLSSWSWLERYMKKGSPQNWDLLKAALGNKHYVKTINESEQNQVGFIVTLETNKFTQQQILELIALVKDNQIRSLIIIHFLSQEYYIKRLKGESVLTRLTNDSLHSPSRLNALVHQLDIKTLTETLIDKLMPEAAVSLLCSIPHFHQLKIEQIDALLKKYPHPEVIFYWINHYAIMPNAHYILAHLMKLADSHLITQLNKMESAKKEAILTLMIAHLELFHPVPKILFEQNKESCLNLAIRFYLNGHQDKVYVHYINRLASSLLSQNHQFSLDAIPLLIALNAKQEFNELTQKTAYLTNYYLRTNAQAGVTRLFYREGRANNESMNQLVQLNPPVPKAVTAGFFNGILGAPTEEKTTQASDIIPEDSLIEKISYRKKQIAAFDYFLIHFHGDKNQIGTVIDDYLSFYAREGCTKNRRKLIYQTSDLMIRPEIEASVRQALFTAFLNYPDLYDKQIAYNLFLFDAQKTIKHFGLQGGEKNYTHVINLCTWALKKLDSSKHAEIRTMAATALAEAELELSANEERSFFGALFMKLKRCWVLGWTGFFSPNLPVYVAPASVEPTPLKKPRNTARQTQLAYQPEPALAHLLQDVTPSSLTTEQFDELIEAFNLFTIKAKPRNEMEIRQKLNELLHQLSLMEQDKKRSEWLKKGQLMVITNYTRLLELTLTKGDRTIIESLLKTIHNKPEYLQKIVDEWGCSLPEELSEASISPVEPNILDTTTELAYSAWSWTRDGLGAFFSPNTEQTAPSNAEQSASTNLISCTQHL